MSMFKVSVVARNTKDESLVSQPAEVLVVTGSELTWLPKELLADIKVTPVRKRNFSSAAKPICSIARLTTAMMRSAATVRPMTSSFKQTVSGYWCNDTMTP